MCTDPKFERSEVSVEYTTSDWKGDRSFTEHKKGEGGLTFVSPGLGTRQIWGMIEDSNMSLKIMPPAAYISDNQMSELKKYFSGQLPVNIHSSIYIGL